jgi:polysaccharide biosynthesis protein PelF
MIRLPAALRRRASADASQPAEAAADVCLLLEGTYPYVMGGVSTWVHDLIRAHPQLTFDVVSLVPDAAERSPRYTLPPNLRHLIAVPLQTPPLGEARAPASLWRPCLDLLPTLVEGRLQMAELEPFARAGAGGVGRSQLLDSPEAFAVLEGAYARLAPGSSFLDFFWSWRSLLNGVLSVLLARVPPARCYHSVSTGFAGLLGARLAAESGRPLILSEHGIYTNERRIELAMAEWLHRKPEVSLAPDKAGRDLRDLWIGAFEGCARLTYAASDPIITLYRGNQMLQLRDGAEVSRLRIVPNGIDADAYAVLGRDPGPRPPTIGLIGRVVPIKDIKTFIRAGALLRRIIPDIQVEVLGPQEEDPTYAAECEALIRELELEGTVHLRGRVQVKEWLPRLDVHVLTSISEAQPLTILEAGAAGVPCVATDVGSCREMIEGDPDGPDAHLGAGGTVVPVADPVATARAIAALLTDPDWHQRAARAMQARIRMRYIKADCDAAYAAIYAQAMTAPRRISGTRREAA